LFSRRVLFWLGCLLLLSLSFVLAGLPPSSVFSFMFDFLDVMCGSSITFTYKRKAIGGKREAGLFSRGVLFWLGCSFFCLFLASCSNSWMSCVGRPSRLLTSEKQKEEREKQACFQEEFCFGWVASFCLSLYVRCPEYHVCGSSITLTYERKAKRREEQACSQRCVFWLSCFFSSSFSSSFFPVVGC